MGHLFRTCFFPWTTCILIMFYNGKAVLIDVLIMFFPLSHCFTYRQKESLRRCGNLKSLATKKKIYSISIILFISKGNMTRIWKPFCLKKQICSTNTTWERAGPNWPQSAESQYFFIVLNYFHNPYLLPLL